MWLKQKKKLLALVLLLVIGAAGLILVYSRLAASATVSVQASQTKDAGGRGANLPYVEYQAEDAFNNGTKMGPDRTFTHLAAEASGRQAVQLNSQGQYVEFTLTQPANSIVARYSIPDSPDGTGLNARLNLYVNGLRQPDLLLTSRYSWFYGIYPFTNNPGGGLAHHFYDEVHTLLPQMPAGSKVRLQVGTEEVAPWYVIDLADFEEVPAPLTQPKDYLSISDYGADASGANDSTQAMNRTLAAVRNQSKAGVWIPPGTFTINGHIIVDNLTVRGAGMWYSVLHGNGIGLYGNYSPTPSQNVKLYDFAIFGEVTNRNDTAQINGIGGALGGGSVIQNIWIEHTKVGIWLDGPFSGLIITGCRLRDLTADGLNLHEGISNTVVEQLHVRNTGDDGLAMWSEKQANHDNVFKFNTVELPILANNIALYGGSDNAVTDNFVSDTLTQGGGIHVGNRFKAVKVGGTTIIARNTLVRTGSWDPNWRYGIGAIWFYALDGPMSGNIIVSDTDINDSSYSAIHFTDLRITNVTFDHININKAGTFAIQRQAPGSAQFNYVTATNLGITGQYDCEIGFTVIKGPGNAGWDDIQCGFPTPK
jgi:hypothetical protein